MIFTLNLNWGKNTTHFSFELTIKQHQMNERTNEWEKKKYK